jgi:hypothetical protein
MVPANGEFSAGDQYDVREGGTGSGGDVRNLGKPVSLAQRYFKEGADEISFLNITGFRDFPLEDLPMLEVRAARMWCRADNRCRAPESNSQMPSMRSRR